MTVRSETISWTKESIDKQNEKKPGAIVILQNEQITKGNKRPGMLESLIVEDGVARPLGKSDDETKAYPGFLSEDGKTYIPLKDGQAVAFKRDDGKYDIFKFKKIEPDKGVGFFFIEQKNIEKDGKRSVVDAMRRDERNNETLSYAKDKLAFDPSTGQFVDSEPLFKTITGKAQEVVTPQPVAPATEMPNPLAGLADGEGKKMPKVAGSLKSRVIGAFTRVKNAVKDIVTGVPISPVLGAGDVQTAIRGLREDNPFQAEDEKEQAKLDAKRKGGLIALGVNGAVALVTGAKTIAQAALATISMLSPPAKVEPSVTTGRDGIPIVNVHTPAEKTPFPSPIEPTTLALVATMVARRNIKEFIPDKGQGTEPKGRG